MRIAARLLSAVIAMLLIGPSASCVSGDAKPVVPDDSAPQQKEPMTDKKHAHTNRLINATSPYLLQHAHNPVDWYPWGPEALAKSKADDKPIFLSIGYSACHWCHVMERESFESEDIAAVMNEHFVCIKVDREERPDLDDIYMNATMLTTGSGGWPMSVWLTPDQKPFFAGTYFPPDARYGRPGFKDILLKISEVWKERRDEVLNSADQIAEAVGKMGAIETGGDLIPRELVAEVAERLAENFDDRAGGMLSGQTNKFPPSMAMALMLRVYHQSAQAGSPKPKLLEMTELTLDHMARGGIYDHLGGGIARYSTDPKWLVPHFEKMLYDQALVSDIYLDAYQLTGNARWADVARDIFDYVIGDLQSAEGGLYSTRDADSEGVEGKFYVWSQDEVLAELGEEAGKLFCSYYDVTEHGNWEEQNILNVQRDAATVAKLHDVSVEELQASLDASRSKLLEVRSKRVPPGLDDKVLTSWNGLMIAALAKGGRLTGDSKYTDAAVKAATFVLDKVSKDGRLLRTCREGKAHTLGYLDDYAFFVDGLLELYQTTFDRRWLDEAVRLNDDMIEHFWDEKDHAFFFTADDAEELFVRSKDSRDSAIPAGNSVALMNLLRLAVMLDRDDLREKADQTIKAFGKKVQQQPFGFDRFLQAVDFRHAAPKEVVIAGDLKSDAGRALLDTVNKVYDPNRIVMAIDPDDEAVAKWAESVPLLRGKRAIDSDATAYVCRNYTCKQPTSDPEAFRVQLLAK